MENQISPTPKKQSKLSVTFSEALTHMVAGSRVTRPEWNEAYGFMSADGIIMVHREGKDYQWIIHQNDILATDWLVVERAN